MITIRLFIVLSLILCLGASASIARAAEPSSVYRGIWTSQSTGHSGPMRVRITPIGGGRYDARFSGRFALVIPFTYRVQLTDAGCDPCGRSLTAHKQLGPILGGYDMSAQMTPGQLRGNFQAAGDSGAISMQRVR